MSQRNPSWEQLKLAHPAGLAPTIQKLHHAAQFVAMIGDSLLPRAEDDGQSSMRWDRSLKALIGHKIDLGIPFRLALVYPAFELCFLDEDDRSLTTLFLEGQSKENVYDWMRENISAFGGRVGDLHPIRHFEIPHHAVDGIVPFHKPNARELEELARYRANADFVLRELSGQFDRSSPVRVWPHHFDTATTLEVNGDRETEQAAKTIGMGWAIPDNLIDDPYFYVIPWRKTGKIDFEKNSELPAGQWMLKKNWKGAVLPATDIVLEPTASAQHKLVQRFLQAAVNESLRLLGGQELTLEKS